MAKRGTKTGRFDTILVDGIGENDPALTGRLDQWEIERIAELEAQERRGETDAPQTAEPPT